MKHFIALAQTFLCFCVDGTVYLLAFVLARIGYIAFIRWIADSVGKSSFLTDELKNKKNDNRLLELRKNIVRNYRCRLKKN